MEGAARTELRAIAPRLARTCADFVRGAREHARQSAARGEGGIALVRGLVATYDGLLSTLWNAAEAVARTDGTAGSAVAVASGSYGRGRLTLHSDLAIAVVSAPTHESFAHAMAELIREPLWSAGLDVAVSVRGIDEMVSGAVDDLDAAMSHLDARRIAGDPSLADALFVGAATALGGPRLARSIERLRKEAAERQARFGRELRVLEPDVLNGRGGIRDLEVALEAAKLARGARRIEDLPRVGLLSDDEWTGVAEADDFLWKVRNLLHARAGRRQERLELGEHAAVAGCLGFGHGEAGAARLIQSFHRHAEAVAHAMDAALEQCRPPRPMGKRDVRDLGGGVTRESDCVTVSEDEVFRRDPTALVRLFRVAAEEGIPVAHGARDLAARAAADVSLTEALRRDPESGRELIGLLGAAPLRHGAGALGDAHAVGVLVALLPEMAPLTGLIQHDLDPIHTVDVHCLRAVAVLGALRVGDLSRDLPLASRFARGFQRFDLVVLAALLHDVGAGAREGHCRRSSEIAGCVARRLGFSDGDCEEVEALVLDHRALARAATLRDTSDPALLTALVRRAGTVERLTGLLLLTIADLGARGTGALSSRKALALEDLHRRASERVDDRVPVRRGEAVRSGALSAWPGGANVEVVRVLSALPDRYLVRNDVVAVIRHARAVMGAGGAVRVRAGPFGSSGDSLEIVVSAPNRSSLAAHVLCALAASRFDLWSAGFFVRADGLALHVARVRADEALASRPEVAGARLERDLADLVAGRTTPQEMLAGRLDQSPPVAPACAPVATEVEVDQDSSDAFTVIDVRTTTRPDATWVAGRAIVEEGLLLAHASADAEGLSLATSFYVSLPGGGKVDDPATLAALRRRLVDLLA